MKLNLIHIFAVAGPVLLFFSNSVSAQNIGNQEKASQNDTVSIMPAIEPAVDSSLVNLSVFTLLQADRGGKIVVNRTSSVNGKFESYISGNKERKNNGYRILVYSSNSQNARSVSQNIENALRNTYPAPVYRSYSAPFFTVHIGNFRTKADAMKLCNELLPTYPQAKIVRSVIDWYSF